MNDKYAPFSAADAERIYAALRAALSSADHHTNKAWLKAADVDHVLSLILDGEVSAAIVEDSYLVVFDHGVPWYSKDVRMVEELLVVKLHLSLTGVSLRAVTRFLEAVAKATDSSYVVAGTAFSRGDAALARMYSVDGYHQEAVTLVKQVKEL